MTNKKYLKVEVSGGLPHERNLLTAIVGKSLRDVGMKEVSITNEIGTPVPASFDKLTVFDMVQGIAPAFFNAPVNVASVAEKETKYRAGYLGYFGDSDRHPEFYHDYSEAVQDVGETGGEVAEIFEGKITSVEKELIKPLPSPMSKWIPGKPLGQGLASFINPQQSSDEDYTNFLTGQINHNANSAIQGHAQELAERTSNIKDNWARTFSSLPATVQKAYEESVQKMDMRYRDNVDEAERAWQQYKLDNGI